MTIMILERVPASLRGDLSRWMIEISTGVFIGKVSKLVRDALWLRCTNYSQQGTVIQAWKMNNEQGFDLRAHKPKGRIPVNYEGIWLIEIHKQPKDSDTTGAKIS